MGVPPVIINERYLFEPDNPLLPITAERTRGNYHDNSGDSRILHPKDQRYVPYSINSET